MTSDFTSSPTPRQQSRPPGRPVSADDVAAAAGAADGLVPTVQVFDRLIASGLDPATAFRRLEEEMDHAGYPKHYAELVRADADAILTTIVGSDAA